MSITITIVLIKSRKEPGLLFLLTEEIATVAPNNNERNRVPPNTSQGSALLSARQYFVSCTTFPQWYNCKGQDFLNRIIIEGRNLDASLRTRN